MRLVELDQLCKRELADDVAVEDEEGLAIAQDLLRQLERSGCMRQPSSPGNPIVRPLFAVEGGLMQVEAAAHRCPRALVLAKWRFECQAVPTVRVPTMRTPCQAAACLLSQRAS